MAKPSIFSRNYEEKMKRRRMNIILFVLLLICMTFFGGLYYLKKNNISLIPDFSSKKQENNKKSEVPKDQKPQEVKPKAAPSTLEYNYTLKDLSNVKLEYTVSGDVKEFKGIKDNKNQIEYAVSPNKKYIVFVDKMDQSLILALVDGNFIDITKENVIYKNGNKLTRKVLNRNKDYIWNAKPQFTSEGNIVYLSNMPNPSSDSGLTLWVTSPKKGGKHTRIKKVSNNITLLKFEGYDEKGRLKLNTPEGYVYISKDGSKVDI